MKPLLFIKYCDLFGYPIQLTLNKQSRFQSVTGGSISLLIIGLFLILFYKGVINLFSYQVFKVDYRTIFSNDPPLQELGNDAFMWAVRISPSIGLQPTKNLFNLTLTQTSRNGSESTKTLHQMEQCTAKHFELLNSSLSDFSKELKNIDFESSLCPPLGLTFSLQGKYNSDVFQFLKFELSPCLDDTKCLDSQQLKQYMETNSISAFNLNFYYTTFSVDPYSEGRLVGNLNSDYYFQFIPFNYYQEVNVFVTESTFIDNRNLLPYVEEIISSKFNSIHTLNAQAIHQSTCEGSCAFGKVYFRAPQQQNQVIKQYQTIDEFLAYFGGIMKIVLAFLGIALYYYNKFGFYVMLANKLYTFNIPNESQEGPQFSYDLLQAKIKDRIEQVSRIIKAFKTGARKLILLNKTIQTKQSMKEKDAEQEGTKVFYLRNYQTLRPHEEDLFQKKKFLEYMFTDILQCQTQIQMAFRYLFSRMLCRRICYSSVNIKLIDKAVNTIYRDMDITVIMDRMKEIDKLKQILLTPNQMMVFDYTPKPVVTIEAPQTPPPTAKVKTLNRMISSKLISVFAQKSNYDSKENLFQLYEAFDALQQANRTNGKHASKKINQKLIDLLGAQLVEIFQTSYQLDEYHNHHENHSHHPDTPHLPEHRADEHHTPQDQKQFVQQPSFRFDSPKNLEASMNPILGRPDSRRHGVFYHADLDQIPILVQSPNSDEGLNGSPHLDFQAMTPVLGQERFAFQRNQSNKTDSLINSRIPLNQRQTTNLTKVYQMKPVEEIPQA